jgi:hypothetical protein
MFMFLSSLYDTDKRYDDTDARNNNTSPLASQSKLYFHNPVIRGRYLRQ